MRYKAQIRLQTSTTFGSAIKTRSYSSGAYRYGFNGKELDEDEEGMGGGGSTYDYGFRIYNPNLGKFLSVDPLSASYPWYTPYQFAGNKPVIAIDLDGLEEACVNENTSPTEPNSTCEPAADNCNQNNEIQNSIPQVYPENFVGPLPEGSFRVSEKSISYTVVETTNTTSHYFTFPKDIDPLAVTTGIDNFVTTVTKYTTVYYSDNSYCKFYESYTYYCSSDKDGNLSNVNVTYSNHTVSDNGCEVNSYFYEFVSEIGGAPSQLQKVVKAANDFKKQASTKECSFIQYSANKNKSDQEVALSIITVVDELSKVLQYIPSKQGQSAGEIIGTIADIAEITVKCSSETDPTKIKIIYENKSKITY